MRVILEPRALDVGAEQAAGRAKLTIETAIDSLQNFPERGVPHERNLRELHASFGAGAYVIRYRVEPGLIIVARIGHSRELG